MEKKRSIDDLIWDVIEKDARSQGFEVSEASMKLKFKEEKCARARGGYTIGQLVHLANLDSQQDITFDDITGVPYRGLASRWHADLTTDLCEGITLPMPLISANMDSVTGYDMAIAMARMGGLGILHQFCTTQEQAREVRRVKETPTQTYLLDGKEYAMSLDERKRYLVGAAIGVKKENLERAKLLVQSGVDVLVLDIAHGHSDQMITLIRTLKEQYPHIPLVAGNVVAPKGAYELCQAGADVIKVGVGPGAACTTRIVTGFGRPQISSIYECALVAKEYGAKVMADGGIRGSGDMGKALAAGADTLMLGSLLAATDKSNKFEERATKEGDKILKVLYYGSASKRSKQGQKRGAYDAPEGREVYLDYSGETEHKLAEYMTGMQSGFSYCGVSRQDGSHANIQRLRTKSRWKRQSPSGLYEGAKGTI